MGAGEPLGYQHLDGLTDQCVPVVSEQALGVDVGRDDPAGSIDCDRSIRDEREQFIQ